MSEKYMIEPDSALHVSVIPRRVLIIHNPAAGRHKRRRLLEVIDSVRRASGSDFAVEISGRRAGDPAALVANVDRIRSTLDWRPQFQDLDTIVSHAFAWERRLPGKRETAVA